ncbi:MAG: ZIP family metal transporter [Endomicrobium sp.]|jgi:ZIP family zinc transporter/zinc and cadmium transporter|nr:ZIP family metal transporter [Endomicrobium sp.]
MGIIYSVIAASAAMLGVFFVLTFHEFAKKNSFLLINFSAGIMLALAFTHLIPESLKINYVNNQTETIMMYVLFGFLSMFILQFIVMFHPCHDNKCYKHTGLVSIIGFSLHSITDGLIIAASFEANKTIGILTTMAIVLHKLPDGITVSSILLHNGTAKNKIFNFSLLTACFTPFGTLLGMFLFKNIRYNILSILLSVTAGIFIFLSLFDLIPEIHKRKNTFTALLMLFIGVFTIIFI